MVWFLQLEIGALEPVFVVYLLDKVHMLCLPPPPPPRSGGVEACKVTDNILQYKHARNSNLPAQLGCASTEHCARASVLEPVASPE